MHGANRLASNSLLEGLVFAHRIADDIAGRLAAGELPMRVPTVLAGGDAVLDASRRLEVQRAMTLGSGPVRSGESTTGAMTALAALAREPATEAEPGPRTWETTNLLHLGQVLSFVANLREETRGGHVRSDFPDLDDARWLTHLTATRDEDGVVVITERAVDAPAAQPAGGLA